MKKYRMTPVEVEAVRIHTGDGAGRSRSGVFLWVCTHGGDAKFGPKGSLLIDTLEGWMRADHGDYIIRGVAGEFYPCKPDIFDAIYEEIQ